MFKVTFDTHENTSATDSLFHIWEVFNVIAKEVFFFFPYLFF